MRAGSIKAVCLAEERGKPKQAVPSAFIKSGYGIEGDSHAGSEDKQVSVLPTELLKPVIEQLGSRPAPGSFAENLLVEGLDSSKIKPGTVLQAGEITLEVTGIGKAPHEHHTYSYKGFSLLADKGIFCRVINSGEVKENDAISIES